MAEAYRARSPRGARFTDRAPLAGRGVVVLIGRRESDGRQRHVP
jgi:hypothetical protein